ncbi:MAG: hypothetical protein L3J16_07280, partial [Anaerolineales bacterium]|nr:hypothetical protein [Anaerolineales bacterium]
CDCDCDWWQRTDRDWRVFLRSLLCAEHQEAFDNWQDGQKLDWIDPETAEVKSVDGLQHTLMSHCALEPDFLTEHTSVVEAIFRTFMINGNTPMSVRALAERLGRPEMTILKTIAGPRVYRGIRPRRY